MCRLSTGHTQNHIVATGSGPTFSAIPLQVFNDCTSAQSNISECHRAPAMHTSYRGTECTRPTEELNSHWKLQVFTLETLATATKEIRLWMNRPQLMKCNSPFCRWVSIVTSSLAEINSLGTRPCLGVQAVLPLVCRLSLRCHWQRCVVWDSYTAVPSKCHQRKIMC